MMVVIMAIVILRSQSVMVIRALWRPHLMPEPLQDHPMLAPITTHCDSTLHHLLQSFL